MSIEKLWRVKCDSCGKIFEFSQNQYVGEKGIDSAFSWHYWTTQPFVDDDKKAHLLHLCYQCSNRVTNGKPAEIRAMLLRAVSRIGGGAS